MRLNTFLSVRMDMLPPYFSQVACTLFIPKPCMLSSDFVVRGRPLSKGGKDTLLNMLEKRDPLYRMAADFTVNVCETPEKTAEEVLKTVVF